MKKAGIKLPVKPVVLFDGVCNLCNGVVQFVIKRDKTGQFLFSSLQSDAGQQILKYYNLPTKDFDSFVLIKNGELYTKSDAAILLYGSLGGVWSVFKIFKWIPKGIRDAVYAIIARNRYNWFGQKESCMVPTPELRARFLD